MFAPIMGIGGTIKAIQYSAGISALAFVIVGAIAVVVVLIIIALTIEPNAFDNAVTVKTDAAEKPAGWNLPEGSTVATGASGL